MHRPFLVAHSLFIEGSHMTKNMASELSIGSINVEDSWPIDTCSMTLYCLPPIGVQARELAFKKLMPHWLKNWCWLLNSNWKLLNFFHWKILFLIFFISNETLKTFINCNLCYVFWDWLLYRQSHWVVRTVLCSVNYFQFVYVKLKSALLNKNVSSYLS